MQMAMLKDLAGAWMQGVRDILSAIPYNANDVWVHSDTALMPRHRATWASWNFMGRTGEDDAAVCVTYWVNRLQTLPKETPDIFVTLNPLTPPAADKVHRQLSLAHPMYGFSTYKAQAKLPYVQVGMVLQTHRNAIAPRRTIQYLYPRILGSRPHRDSCLRAREASTMRAHGVGMVSMRMASTLALPLLRPWGPGYPGNPGRRRRRSACWTRYA